MPSLYVRVSDHWIWINCDKRISKLFGAASVLTRSEGLNLRLERSCWDWIVKIVLDLVVTRTYILLFSLKTTWCTTLSMISFCVCNPFANFWFVISINVLIKAVHIVLPSACYDCNWWIVLRSYVTLWQPASANEAVNVRGSDTNIRREVHNNDIPN